MKKPPRQRARRGSVKVNERSNESLQLRWTAAGRRFSLSVGINNPLNLHHARKLAAQIEQDLIVGAFDPTLAKYKPEPIIHAEPEPEPQSTAELFEQFIESRRQAGTSGQAIATRYSAMLSNLKRFEKTIDSEPIARQFVDMLRSRQSPRIANQNLTMLKAFRVWAIEHQLMELNPFVAIKPLKAPKTPSPKRKPFTRDEVLRLLQTAKTHPGFYR